MLCPLCLRPTLMKKRLARIHPDSARKISVVDHRSPSHISNTVPSTVHVGPPKEIGNIRWRLSCGNECGNNGIILAYSYLSRSPPSGRPYGLIFFTWMGTPIHPPIPISTTYDISTKGRGNQHRYRQRAPIDSHKDRYVWWVVTSGGVSQMRVQPQSQTAARARAKKA